jgi:hypothetical protein
MSNKQFKSALRRLRNGVTIYLKDQPFHKRGTFKIEPAHRANGFVYRGIVIVHTDFGDSFVEMIWEVTSLDWLRRIAVGYYPAVAKAFGPARNFVGSLIMAGRPKGSRNKRPPKGSIPAGVKVQKYDWTIIDQEFDSDKHKLFYIAQCKCGNTSRVVAEDVISGRSRGCNKCAKRKSGETRAAIAKATGEHHG